MRRFIARYGVSGAVRDRPWKPLCQSCEVLQTVTVPIRAAAMVIASRRHQWETRGIHMSGARSDGEIEQIWKARQLDRTETVGVRLGPHWL